MRRISYLECSGDWEGGVCVLTQDGQWDHQVGAAGPAEGWGLRSLLSEAERDTATKM